MREITKDTIYASCQSLKSLSAYKLGKYHRNYRRYNYTPGASLQNIRLPSVVGFYEQGREVETDTTNSTNERHQVLHRHAYKQNRTVKSQTIFQHSKWIIQRYSNSKTGAGIF